VWFKELNASEVGPGPSVNTIQKIYAKRDETGSVQNKKALGNVRTVRTQENQLVSSK